MTSLLYDAKRFVLKFRGIIDTAPLQMYTAGVVFSPLASSVQELFSSDLPVWLRRHLQKDPIWQDELQTLEGHSKPVTCVKFAPDGTYLASGSDDCCVRFWDASSGACLQTLYHDSGIRALTFSGDGQFLAASSSGDFLVYIWDTV